MQAIIVIPTNGGPVRLVRKHKPRGGGGETIAEFTNRDGSGVEAAVSYAAKKGHNIWKERAE